MTNPGQSPLVNNGNTAIALFAGLLKLITHYHWMGTGQHKK